MSDFTKSQKKEILKECFDEGGCCTNCGCKMVFPKYIDSSNTDPDYWKMGNAAQVDHVYPKSKGGNAKLWNAQVLCRECNSSKSNEVTTTSYVKYHSKNTADGIAAFVELCSKCSIL